MEKPHTAESTSSLEQNHQQVVVAENTQEQINVHENYLNFLNTAKQIANDKGYAYETVPILFALVKSLNGKQDEILNYLDEGKEAVTEII